MKLQINEGPIDRGIRIVLGIALLAAAAAGLIAAPIVYVTSFVGAAPARHRHRRLLPAVCHPSAQHRLRSKVSL